MGSLKQFLHKTYYNPGNPASFSSIKKLRDAAIAKGFTPTYKQIQEWLLHQQVYSLSKAAHTNFPRGYVVQSGLHIQWDLDLIDFNNIKAENDGYPYILMVMDQFSRFLYTVKLPNKTPQEVASALAVIIQKSSITPRAIYHDAGMEFIGAAMKEFCLKHKIKQFVTSTEHKNAQIERCIRTIKVKIFKYFLHMQHHRWVDIIPKITSSYNHSKHSALGLAPAEVTSENAELVRYNASVLRSKRNLKKPQQSPHDSTAAHSPKGDVKDPLQLKKEEGKKQPKKVRIKKSKPRYRIGETVRISRIKNKFHRAFDISWSAEKFKIVSIVVRQKLYMYKIVSCEDDEKIDGYFYEQELSKAYKPHNESYNISEILKYSGTGKKKRAFVSWFLFPKKYNSWIPAKNIKNIPGVKERAKVQKSIREYHRKQLQNQTSQGDKAPQPKKAKAPLKTVKRQVSVIKEPLPLSLHNTRVLRSATRAANQKL